MAMIYRLLFLSLLISSLLSCQKEIDDNAAVKKESITGFSYFLNTNEKWSIHAFRAGPPQPHYYQEFSIIGDTTVFHDGDTFQAKLFREYLKTVGPDDSSESTFHLAFHFSKDERILRKFRGTIEYPNYYYQEWHFNDLDYIQTCENPITLADTIIIGSNHFKRFINTQNQEIIEGISLGFAGCQLISPLYYDFIGLDIIEYKYTSDEFSYIWRKNPFE